MSLHFRTSDAAGEPAVTRAFRFEFGTVAILAGLAPVMLLSGCAWFAPDAGMGVVATIAQQELNKDAAAIRSPEEAEAASATVRRLLGRPLTADAAVQIALLNNRGLQAAYNELAIADAERVGQSLPPNPTFSWRRIQAGPALESEMQLVTNILALATLPARSEIAAERFHQAQLRAAEETLRVAARRAARLLSRRCRARARSLPDGIAVGGRSRDPVGSAPRRNRRDEQARSGARAGVLCRYDGAAGDRAPARGEANARRLFARWAYGATSLDFKLPNALPAVPRRVQTLAGDRGGCGCAARRSADRPHRARRAREVLRPHPGHSVHQHSRRGLRR